MPSLTNFDSLLNNTVAPNVTLQVINPIVPEVFTSTAQAPAYFGNS